MFDIFFDKMLKNEASLPMHQHTNHLPIHSAVLERMKETVEKQEWVYYGGPTGSTNVKEIIAQDLNVDLDKFDILLTNGAMEAFYMIMNQFKSEWNTFIDCVPSWPWPRRFSKAFGVPVTSVLLRKLRPSDIIAGSCVNILNGQHPQSLLYTDAELIALAEKAADVNAWFIHDMTYRDFFPEYPNLLEQNPERGFVTFSFSKGNSLAGLRIGGLVCSKENTKSFVPLNPARLGVNVIAEQAAIASIETKYLWKQKNIDIIAKNNKMIYSKLSDLETKGILNMPKKDIMNDVWINFLTVSSSWVTEELKKRKVLVNDTATRAYFKAGERYNNANHITVTTSVPEYWIDYFCEQLNEILK